jgi:hypothetical protein
METKVKEAMVAACIQYIQGQELPTPFPTNAVEYGTWRDQALEAPEPEDDEEEAWFELYRLIDEQPDDAWEVICELSARCRTESECATLAAGPLTTFVRNRRAAFAERIDEELARNTGFRMAYQWL